MWLPSIFQFHHCYLCRSACRRFLGLCIWVGRGVDLALHTHAAKNGDVDCCVRPDSAGLLSEEFRHALEWAKLWPFILGAAIGVPVGIAILGWANPSLVKAGIGVVLVLYSLYVLAGPKTASVTAGGAAADAGVGFLNGVLGGTTGLAGIVVTVWCGLRGWPKDRQRTIFQPVAVAIFLMSAAWPDFKGAVSADTIRLWLQLPALLAATWLGMKLYGRLDEARFRRVVLILLLVSGAALLF